jgi:hypothetical protein
VLLAVLGVAAGCAKKPDDAKITSSIQASFNGDSGLQGKQLAVQTSNGTVTLSGSVDNDAQRDAAARYAAAIPGVKTVVNNLQVGGAQPADTAQNQEPPAAAEPAPAPAEKPAPSRRHHHSPKSSDDSGAMDSSSMAQSQPMTPPPAASPAPAIVPAAEPAPPPPPPPPQKVTIPAGTTISVRLEDGVDSETATQGQSFRATLNSPLSVEGDVAIPTGHEVEGHVVSVQSAGKFAGKSELTLQLDRISVNGKSYSIQTDQWHREGSSRGKNTAEKVGAGSVIGAIIGGIAGGGKGAAIGAAAGGGVGGGVQAATKGQQIKLPVETVLTFTLQAPVSVLPAKGPSRAHPTLDSNQ